MRILLGKACLWGEPCDLCSLGWLSRTKGRERLRAKVSPCVPSIDPACLAAVVLRGFWNSHPERPCSRPPKAQAAPPSSVTPATWRCPAAGPLPGAPAKPSALGMGPCPVWPSTPWGRPRPDTPILPGGPASPVSIMTPVEPGRKGSPVQRGHAGGGSGCRGLLGRTGCWPVGRRFPGSSGSRGALGLGRGVGLG